MNSRQRAFRRGLQSLRGDSAGGKAAPLPAPVGRIRPQLYTARKTPVTNQIVQGDSIKILNDGPEGWIDLVFADPPFNIGYLYEGYDDRREIPDYLNFSRDWMKAVHRSLAPTGSFFLAIGDDYAADLCVIARRELGFHLRNWIIWHYTFGQSSSTKFARSHTHILYFTKAPTAYTFNADPVRVASARQTTYGDARANPKGKVPDDVWYLRPQEAAEYFQPDDDVWNVSRVCGTFKEREGWHGCQMPIGVLDRIVKCASNPGDIVLDPFNGSGTTIISAALLGRQYVGIDQSQEYVSFARKRLEHALAKASESGDPTAALLDKNRESRVMTQTDAFGRKRATRQYKKRQAKTA